MKETFAAFEMGGPWNIGLFEVAYPDPEADASFLSVIPGLEH